MPGRARAPVEDLGQPVAQGVEALARLEPEYRAQDHLERERLEPRMQLERLVARPRGDLALADLRDQIFKPLHALAVERRQHQLALLQMLGFVEQQHRALADDRPEDARPLARDEARRRGR